MVTLTNVELNSNLYNPVIFFDLNGTKYAVFTDGPEKVLTADMDGICDVLSSQMKMNKNVENETTTIRFDDFYIVSSGNKVTGVLN